MAWIKQRTVEAKLPFCWRDSYGRGAGWVPGRVADCPKGVQAPPCLRVRVFDECCRSPAGDLCALAGWINMGATCLLPADTISTPSTVAHCPAGLLVLSQWAFLLERLIVGGCQWT